MEKRRAIVSAVNGCYTYLKAKNTVDMENLGDNTIWPSVTDYQRIGTVTTATI